MASRDKEIVILLGAGASAEAGIPTSALMIEKIETLLKNNSKWKVYDDLYNHVKSSIFYAAGLRGVFQSQVNYNIETLVNTLYELERNEDHPLYPFIAAWNSRFVALAKPDFSNVKEFRHLILSELKKWMCPTDTSAGDYYFGLGRLQKALNYPLQIFSLNYDLCVERLSKNDFRVETGFEDFGPNYSWDFQRFSDASPGPLPEMWLYKLHGSINWMRDAPAEPLYSVEQVENVDLDRMEVIFGRDFKLEAADPYLFYAYVFRKSTLEDAKLIITIGYGFQDGHINKMLVQGLKADPNRRLVVIQNCKTEDSEKVSATISGFLFGQSTQHAQIIVEPGSAKSFLEIPDLDKHLSRHIPEDQEAPF